MEKFWEKLDQYLFDVVGIFLPGFLALLLLSLLTGINLCDQGSSNHIVFENSQVVILLLLGFLLGHAVKYFSVFFYKCFVNWLDKGIYRGLAHFSSLLNEYYKRCCNFLLNRLPVGQLPVGIGMLVALLKAIIKKTFQFFARMLLPLKEFLWDDLMRFKTKPYDPETYKNMERYVLEKLREDREFENMGSLTDDSMLKNEIYKISDIISRNKGIKSIWQLHHAKYNCYRSLAFIFFVSTVSCTCILVYRNKIDLIKQLHPSFEKYLYIGIISFVLFLTFHHKFKRYFTLCSAEALSALFYFYYDIKAKKS